MLSILNCAKIRIVRFFEKQMKIRRGMRKTYLKWLEKNRSRPYGKVIIDTADKIGKFLEFGGTGEEAFRIFVHPKRCRLQAGVRAYIVLSVSRLHPFGGDVRFHWNKFYRGDVWAIAQELSAEFRVYDPSR